VLLLVIAHKPEVVNEARALAAECVVAGSQRGSRLQS
jgi:hypothetical protein